MLQSIEQVRAIMEPGGVDAVVECLGRVSVLEADDRSFDAISGFVSTQSAAILVETSAEARNRRLELLIATVRCLIELAPTECSILYHAHAAVLESMLTVGPAATSEERVAPAMRRAKTLASDGLSSDPILREIERNFLHRAALVACAMRDDQLAVELIAAVGAKHAARDGHLLKLLEPYGVLFPNQ